MRTARGEPILDLLPAEGCLGGRSGLGRTHRPDPSGAPLPGQPQDSRPAGQGRQEGQPQKDPAADAADGPSYGVSEASGEPAPGHTIYPYLLRNLAIERPNQVWAADICYIPMAKGNLYLVVLMDWTSRKVLSWELSTTCDTAFCLTALEKAVGTYGRPEIFNTDQGA